MDITALLDNGTGVQLDNSPSAAITVLAEDMQDVTENATQVDTTGEPTASATTDADSSTVMTESIEDTRCFAALNLREVLAVILAHSDNCSAARAARVNSHWSEVALDILYQRSPELFDLVSILAPISETYFSRELLPADWARFSHYAPRVHTLSHDTTGSHSGRHLSESLFQELALSRPNLLIFPNLHTLSWTVSRPRFLRVALLFLHSNVPLRNLTLHITRADGAKTFDSFLQSFGERVPRLESFTLDTPRPVGEYTAPFVNFLTKCRALTFLTLPHFFLSTPMMEALGGLPHLESVTLRKRDHIGASADVANLVLPTSPGYFQTLEHLSIDCHLSTLTAFISGSTPHLTLKSLHVSSLALECPSAINTFLSALPTGVPNLQSLMLALLTLSVPSPAHSTDITLNTISPIMSLKHLEAFGLTYNYPLALSSSDIDELARALPLIKKLYLCESSYDTHDRSATTLGLDTLVSFARHCPRLEELGVFIDAGVPSPPPRIPEGVRFNKLQTLSVGQSFMPLGMSPSSSSTDLPASAPLTSSITAIALFLSRLLPPLPLQSPQKSEDSVTNGSSPSPSFNFDLLTGCTALPHSFSPTYHEASPHPESDDVFQERLNSWTEVRRITGVLLEVAREVAEQERERLVEKEQVREDSEEQTRQPLAKENSDDEILRLRAEISRLQLEVEELKRRSSTEATAGGGE